MLPNQLSLRSPKAHLANRLRDPETNSEQDRNASPLLILIHGYQSPFDKAEGRYEEFRAALRATLPGGIAHIGAVWELYWPGDHDNFIVSLASYAVRVPIATGAGERLAEQWIARRRPEQTVYIVAHSLGCRVALDAVRKIREMREAGYYNGATVEAVFLLAAAVPVNLCEDDPEFFPPPSDHAEYALHSTKDGTLKRWFGPGQWIAGEQGPAVGRFGDPKPGRWNRQKDMAVDHGDYWSSRDVAAWICDKLGLMPTRDIDDRSLPSADTLRNAVGVPSRNLPSHPRPVRFI